MLFTTNVATMKCPPHFFNSERFCRQYLFLGGFDAGKHVEFNCSRNSSIFDGAFHDLLCIQISNSASLGMKLWATILVSMLPSCDWSITTFSCHIFIRLKHGNISIHRIVLFDIFILTLSRKYILNLAKKNHDAGISLIGWNWAS